jgi:tetratricopeptide (TPR) repeat protein
MRYFLFVLFFLSVITAVAQSRQEWRDSLETLSASLKQDPDNIDLRLRKAEADIQLERWDYALAEYGRILRTDEKNLAALYFRAYVHERQKHYDLARVDYESFLAIQPLHLEARLGLAHILQKMGRRSDAMDVLNQIVQMFPDSADAYAARAAFETKYLQYELALYDWNEAIRLRPDNEGFVISKVDLLIRLKRKKEAREELDALVSKGTPRGMLKEWYDRAR